MTDAEIINALKICSNKRIGCKRCPYLGIDGCIRSSMLDAIDLIQRQQEQIKALITGQETLQKHFAEEKKRIVEQLEKLTEDARLDACPDSKYRDGCIENCQLCYVFAAIKIVKGVQNE